MSTSADDKKVTNFRRKYMEWDERDLTGQQHGWEHDEIEAGGRQQLLGASIARPARAPASHPLDSLTDDAKIHHGAA
jgi:hypothetical protein